MVFRRSKRGLGAAFALAALAAASAATAHAGGFHVYSCHTPAGQPAPTEGWSSSTSGVEAYAENTCAQPGGALLAALGPHATRATNTDFATWALTLPSWASVTSATLWRAGEVPGGVFTNAWYSYWFAGPRNVNSAAYAFGQCTAQTGCVSQGNPAQPLAPGNMLVVPPANLGSGLYVNAGCVGVTEYACGAGSGANRFTTAVRVYALDLVLEQSAGPSVSQVAGPLAGAVSVAGNSALTFSASDSGSGVYQAIVSVDGQLSQVISLDDNGGRCHSVGSAADGLPAFLYAQPCAGSVGAQVGLDTTRLANGPHHLSVSVGDAAGNSALVLDRVITVANPPAACAPGTPENSASPQGTLSAGWKEARRAVRTTRLTAAFGRAHTITGQLLGPSGAPVGGAEVELVATPASIGAGALGTIALRTGTDGRFSVRVPAGTSSRTLCLAYSPGPGARGLSRILTLSTRAGIALNIAPRRASVGQAISFRGHLLGGPVPPAGKQLVLEARSGGSPWLQFQVIRAGPRGRFHAGYRFRFPGPASYQFRVVSEPESDYPYAAGASNVVDVHER